VECGSNVISGVNAARILEAVKIMVSQHAEWPFPKGYDDPYVSSKVVKFILGGNGVV
jgi:UDP-N-acetylglucosamine 2-epimerase (non-hydrolysing)